MQEITKKLYAPAIHFPKETKNDFESAHNMTI